MNILITGTKGIAKALKNAYNNEHSVTTVSLSTGHDINNISNWGDEFLDYDCVFNCAYDKFAQITVLEFFFNHWHANESKKIITVGSKVSSVYSVDQHTYWGYRLHKQALQEAHNKMLLTAKCDMKIINPGPTDTAMIAHKQILKFDPATLALKIKGIVEDPTIKRVDLWL